jgi:predicted MFS family arabinose efflux permease
MNKSPQARPLLTFEFLSLCLIIVMAFSNVCVFYSFYYYLGAIGIPVAWRGFLVGLEPMAAFALRLFVLPWLHLRNAYAIVMASLVLLIAVSCSYLFVTSVAGLIAVRIAHGAVFVLLTSAAISLMITFIPAEKSGQGFSALSVATMIPYVIIPPLTEALLPYTRSAADIYAGVSVFSLLGIALMIGMRRRILRAIGQMDAVLMRKLTLAEIRENFRQHAVLFLLAAILLLYLAHATFFYFLKNLSLQTGVGHVGAFFGISMSMMIAVRLFGTFVFDRINKLKLLLAVLLMLTACLLILPGVKTPACFYLLAVVYGGSIGVTIPVFNALLFSVSAPGLRGLNTNMTLFAMDAGYFLTPCLGGLLITLGASFGMLFYTAAGFALLCLFLTTVFFRKKGEFK